VVKLVVNIIIKMTKIEGEVIEYDESGEICNKYYIKNDKKFKIKSV
jgi:hypothetical protein